MSLPPNHPQRTELNDEAHARPAESLTAPLRISYLALLSPPANRAAERAHIAALATALGAIPPSKTAIHYSANLGRFRLKWERHSEFSRYKFIAAGESPQNPFEDTAIQKLPPAWLAALPGQTLVATHIALLPTPSPKPDYETLSARLFAGNALVGAQIAGGAATALTDFRIRPDNFSRLLVLDTSLRPRQAGRAIQRLLEIDTYRLMALLTFPLARALAPALEAAEQELSKIAEALNTVTEAGEPDLLNRLTHLAADIESFEAKNNFRFSAARAYHSIVQSRIEQLRESRIPAIQTFREFTELRLAPAMNTCEVTATRMESLSARVARATTLLSTRVDITREQQTIQVLQSMNRRADIQLRLQQTVEGLSIAAITYYIVGLIGYAVRAAKSAGLPINPDQTMGLSIPFVILIIFLATRRIHRMVHKSTPPPHP